MTPLWTRRLVIVGAGVGLLALAVVGSIVLGTGRLEEQSPSREEITRRPDPRPEVPEVTDVVAPEALVTAARVETAPTPVQPAATPLAASTAAAPGPALVRPLEVVVVDSNGSTVSDAVVELHGDATKVDFMHSEVVDDPTWLEPLATWKTDGTGVARIFLPDQASSLLARHADRGASQIVEMEGMHGKSIPHVLRLELLPALRVRGHVLDVSGAPAVGARVVFSLMRFPGDSSERPRLPRPVEVGHDGRFEVTLDAKFQGQVRAELDGRKTLDEYLHLEWAPSREIELRFPGAFAITGLVLGPAGAPVPEASVEISDYGVSIDPATTDAMGRFRLEPPEDVSAVVVASAEGLVQDDGVFVAVNQETPTVDVTLRLIAASTISGRVQFSDGTPVPQAMLFAHPGRAAFKRALDHFPPAEQPAQAASVMGFVMSLDATAHGDRDGQFTFRDIHPRYSVDISCFGDDLCVGDVSVEDVQPGSQNVLVVFERADASQTILRGHVVDTESGAPVTRYDVQCAEWGFGGLMPFGVEHAAVEDPSGSFSIEGLEPGSDYGLVIEAVNYPATTFGPFRPSTRADVELSLGRHGTLRVVVVDEAGAPQARATIELMSGQTTGFRYVSTPIESHTAADSGLFECPNLMPGPYTVGAALGNRRASPERVEVAPGRVNLVQLTLLEVRDAGSLEVRVVHKDGSPWTGTSLKVLRFAEKPEVTLAEPELLAVHTGNADEGGRIVVGGLVPGTYVGFVSGGQVPWGIGKVEIKPNETTTMNVTPEN